MQININYMLGIAIVAILAALSIGIAKIPAVAALSLSPLIVGILLGVLLSFVYHKKQDVVGLGVTFSAKKILRFGIILYGFNVSIAEIGQVGFIGIVACIFVVAIVMGLGVWIGVKWLKLDRDIAILVSGGSAICGAAAVLALESSLRSEAYKGVIAVGTVVIFGLIAMFLYPILYASGIIPFTHAQEGLYIGLTLHEVANVVGAGGAISPECANFALITKMIRVILLIPLLLIIPLLCSRTQGTGGKKLHIPWFAFGFLGVVILHSYIDFSDNIVMACKFVSAFCLTMAMSALGLQIDFKKFKSAGGGAFMLAFILFILLCVGGFLLVYGLTTLGYF
ncbi:YeiH family protein [Helicobacter trogontum]|uniref:Putative sulfate exporter family transporter n=1 Tax=Helicobacter trogontum TaxID=50960 RepID=A0A4U8SBD7_9HELI|nr:putative sulfate exporter family transporter [Helicobacter trogontum]TLD83359.1 putative sulfate exporter family transporter [Helicobacter trogontum]